MCLTLIFSRRACQENMKSSCWNIRIINQLCTQSFIHFNVSSIQNCKKKVPKQIKFNLKVFSPSRENFPIFHRQTYCKLLDYKISMKFSSIFREHLITVKKSGKCLNWFEIQFRFYWNFSFPFLHFMCILGVSKSFVCFCLLVCPCHFKEIV